MVLDADPSPSGPVNDRIPDIRSSGGFSGGKKKSRKIEGNVLDFSGFFLDFLDFFWIFSNSYV